MAKIILEAYLCPSLVANVPMSNVLMAISPAATPEERSVEKYEVSFRSTAKSRKFNVAEVASNSRNGFINVLWSFVPL